MPKKQKKALYTRPSTSPHPSLTLSRSTTSAPHGSPAPEDNRSVTDCLKSLRIEEARSLPPRPPPVATVHPSLRNILDVPETPQPRRRAGIRTIGPPQTRRIPGPAAPPSWQLLASRHAPKIMENEHLGLSYHAARDLACAQVFLPGATPPSRRSLLHTALRAMSDKWDWHLQNDHSYLASLPLHLREVLLTYVAVNATDESLGRSHSTLRVLFPDENDFEAGLGADQGSLGDVNEVTRLDLGRALGTWLRTTSSLKRVLIRPRVPQRLVSSDLEAMPGGVREGLLAAPECWDDARPIPTEIEAVRTGPISLLQLPTLKFSNLLHLSLNLSPSTPASASVASWSSLLSITSHLSILQSLALGYWPRPTLTPHAAARSARVRNPLTRTLPSVSYGGTDMYTESESSWREAAGILRRLSRHLYCLRWLDLTGCGAWFGALSWTETGLLDDSLGSEARVSETGPDWNGSWRSVEYLVLSVGWASPSLEDKEQISISSESSTGGQTPSSPSTNWLNSRLGSVAKIRAPQASTNGSGLIKQDWDVEEERRKHFARKIIEKFNVMEAKAREVSRHLRALRERTGGKWIEVNV